VADLEVAIAKYDSVIKQKLIHALMSATYKNLGSNPTKMLIENMRI